MVVEDTRAFKLVKTTGHCCTVQWEVSYCVRSSRHHNLYRLIGVQREAELVATLKLFLLLQRSTAVQVRSSVRLRPQNQPSGRGLLPSPTAWSPDQHPAAMLGDVSRHILGRTEGRGLGSGQLVRTHKGKCLKCQSSSDGHSDHSALFAGGR